MSESRRTSESIARAEGLTPTENYLKRLCEKSFLSLWSYPNLYRKPGKELCDLLVVFENDILVFSDKRCRFSQSGDKTVDWSRWFKRAVERSAKQAWGAEHWIRSHPQKVFLDPACTKLFPLDLPDMQDARFHLLLVAHGVSASCAAEMGGSGSLMVRTDIRGLNNHTVPFAVGDLDPDKTFVHVLDDASLLVVMQTLDTISDFTAYFRKKEQLLRSREHVFIEGEENLLAVYLKHLNSNGEHDFPFSKDHNGILLTEGHWGEFQENPQRKAQIEANRISYTWDGLIEKFNYYALAGRQFYSSHPGIQSTERILRFMAREPRTRRRVLAKSLIGLLEKTGPDLRGIRVGLPSQRGDPHYVFLLLPPVKEYSYDENRELRELYLEACCRVVKNKFPEAEDIVGIATEAGIDRQDRSEDAVYLDARDWTDRHIEETRRMQDELGILVNTAEVAFTEQEYPDPP